MQCSEELNLNLTEAAWVSLKLYDHLFNSVELYCTHKEECVASQFGILPFAAPGLETIRKVIHISAFHVREISHFDISCRLVLSS